VVVFVIEVVRIVNICDSFHFVLVVSDALFLKEDIDISWLFVGKVDWRRLHCILIKKDAKITSLIFVIVSCKMSW
jgi:hypothetical protein